MGDRAAVLAKGLRRRTRASYGRTENIVRKFRRRTARDGVIGKCGKCESRSATAFDAGELRLSAVYERCDECSPSEESGNEAVSHDTIYGSHPPPPPPQGTIMGQKR